MTIPRLFHPDLSPGQLVLSPDESRHAATVLRCRAGDHVILFDGQGNQAAADIIVHSIIPDERLEFTREQGIWKMNLLRLLPRQEEKLMTTLMERGQTEEEFFLNFLKQETGKEPSPDIWKPLVPSPEQG